MRKILHIITGLNDGGAEGVLYRLCTYDKAHQHTVISLTDMGKYGPMLEFKGIEVHTLDLPRGKVTLKALLRLRQLIKQIKPDVVQTWMYHADLIGGICARLAGVKKVFWGIRHGESTSQSDSRKTSVKCQLALPVATTRIAG